MYAQGVRYGESCRPERAEVVQEHGYVEMRPPLTGSSWRRVPRLDRIAKVEEARELAVPKLGCLAQVNRLGELPELGNDLAPGVELLWLRSAARPGGAAELKGR